MDAQFPMAFGMISASTSKSREINENYRNLCTETNMDSRSLERAWQTYRTTAQTLEEITEPEKTTEPDEDTEPGETSESEETAEQEETPILTIRTLDNCAMMTHKDAMKEAWCAFADADTIEEGRRDFNATMSKIVQAREEPSTPSQAPERRQPGCGTFS